MTPGGHHVPPDRRWSAPRPSRALIYLDAILYLSGGISDQSHHRYFTGQDTLNMRLASCSSAPEGAPLMLLILDAWDLIELRKGAVCRTSSEKTTLKIPSFFPDQPHMGHHQTSQNLKCVRCVLGGLHHVGIEALADQFEYHIQEFVFAFEVAIDRRRDQPHSSGDPRHTEPFRPWLVIRLNAAWASCSCRTSVSSFPVPIV